MKWNIDSVLLGKIVVMSLIGFLFFYMIYSTAQFGGGNAERQQSSIEDIINKALVQCYALEGSFPADINYVEKYGVIFDNDKYLYHYEWYGGNIMPTINVIER